MRLISRVKALAGALLLAGCLTQQAAAASFVGNRDDFRDETIYFVMTTRFYDGDKSNNVQCWDGQQYNDGDPAWRGDFKGLIEKLDYIKALGFTAIWITPVVENASGYDYHGYHASDFSKVDHRYESEDVTFKSLIDAAHQRGMKVILDIVLNHTGNFGEANLCKLFDRNWKGDQSDIDACMIPFTHTNMLSCQQQYADNGASTQGSQPTSDNVFLRGNTYHKPDYSKYSGLSVIDFPMHHNFRDIGSAWGIARSGDKYYNDASYNVVYVDSHDYAPNGAPEDQRFAQGTDTWAENLSLMFTFRGIPCLYYGSEIEFKKGCTIDKGPNIPLKDSGRAYFGGYIKGDIQVNDFADWTGATGNMNATLNYPLALHIQRLNRIRMAIPALRKGQYSTEGCAGSYAFKRRFTDATTDSYVLVTISGDATFSGIENGTYVDAITGDTKTVTDGQLTANCSGRGNMRIYVLNTALTPAPGKVGEDGKFLYGASPVSNTQPAYDGTQEELTDNPGGGNPGGGSNPGEDIPEYTPQFSNGEMAVFFEAPADNSYKKVSVWCWSSTTKTNFTGGASAKWPGERATMMGKAANGNLIWKWTFTGTVDTSDMPTHIIFSNAGSPQTDNLEFKNGGYYTINGVDHVVNPTTSSVDGNVSASLRAYAYSGTIFVIAPEATTVTISSIDGRTFTQPVEQGENRIVGFGKGIYIVEGQKIIL